MRPAAFVLPIAMLLAPVAEAAVLRSDAGQENRLVLEEWPEGGWIVEQIGRQVEVRFPAENLEIDASGLDLSPLTGAVDEVSSRVEGDVLILQLDLGCDCRVALHGNAATGLIFDVIGAPALAGASEAASDETAPEAVPAASPASQLQARADGSLAPLASPMPVPRPAHTATAQTDPTPAAASESAAAATPTPTPAPQPAGQDAADFDVAALRERLMSQLARAAEAGLIELRPGSEEEFSEFVSDEPPAPGAPIAEDTPGAAPVRPTEAEARNPQQGPAGRETDATQVAEAAPVAADPSGAGADVTPIQPDGADAGTPDASVAPGDAALAEGPAETPDEDITAAAPTDEASQSDASEDLGAPSDLAQLPMPQGGAHCLPESTLLLPDPAGPLNFVSGVAAGNSLLIGEFDQPNEDAAVDLARHYLGHGLGIEATATLADFAPNHPTTPALAAMAALIAGQSLPEGHALSADNCGGVQEVWARLADARASALPEGAAGRIVESRALERVPPDLRGRIAAEIGLAAFDNGEVEEAAMLRALADRSDPDLATGHLVSLLSARIARAEGEPDPALGYLQAMRQADGSPGTIALIEIADMVLKGEVPGVLGTQQLRTDLGARALELRGTDLGAEAFVVEAELLGRASGREPALALLSHGLSRGLIDRDRYFDAVRRVSSGQPVGADERPLALIYHDDPERFQLALDEPGFRHALGRSYAEIGTPLLAKDILRRGDLEEPVLAQVLVDAALGGDDLEAAQMLVTALPAGDLRDRVTDYIDRRRLRDAALAGLVRDGEGPWLATEVTDAELAERMAELKDVMETNPSVEAAKALAIAAAATGSDTMPEEAVQILEDAGGSARELARLFDTPNADGLEPSAEAMAEYINALTNEVEGLREMLENG